MGMWDGTHVLPGSPGCLCTHTAAGGALLPGRLARPQGSESGARQLPGHRRLYGGRRVLYSERVPCCLAAPVALQMLRGRPHVRGEASTRGTPASRHPHERTSVP